MPDPYHADRAERDARDAQLLADIGAAGRRDARLTAAELRALDLRSHGLSDAQVATDLSLSVEAVKSRLKRARYKLGAKTTLHACCEAIRRGLIN